MTDGGKITFEVAMCLAASCFALGFWLRKRELAPRSWPQSQGKITTSEMKLQYVGKGTNELLPVIWYKFTHEGKEYVTDHWRIGNFSIGSREDSEAITKKFQLGRNVTVFVNPANPEKSVLEHSITMMSWIPIGFGVFFSLFALLPLIVER
jgi:hypothetical protein